MTDFQVAAYYFPNYHVDTRNERWHGKGWTEWELVRRAEPRFPGHNQPKTPLWGYEDEADPAVMAKKIDAAADHGLSAFIFDWYWHTEGPYLYRCLEEGFLRASNNERLRFALMWANHDWVDIHPATRHKDYPVLAGGAVDESIFIAATDHIISHYFSRKNYWRIGGGLYFSVYELMSLVKGLGGLTQTKRVLDGFRTRIHAAGLGDLHLNAVVWGVQILPGEERIQSPNEMLAFLGFDSVTSYVWIHHADLPVFPQSDYGDCREEMLRYAKVLTTSFGMPYYPNVTMGWDSSPRTIQSDVLNNLGYPHMPMLAGNTPAAFKQALYEFKKLMEETGQNILTINAWNEWTEGSYLEPDTVHGMGYLEAIKTVFSA